MIDSALMRQLIMRSRYHHAIEELFSVKDRYSIKPPVIVFTVGHSNRSLYEFVRMLKTYGVRRLLDIRTIPRSRHNPQFNRETLAIFLRNRHINYRHIKALGGLRHALVDSPNMGWHNTSFRGFADYMQTREFEEALQRLIEFSV